MPLAIPMAKRQALIEQFLDGKPISQIATEFNLSYATVWTLCQRYKKFGPEGLVPRYENCGSTSPKYDALTYRAVRCLKTWHPGWGGGRIRVLLARKYPDKPLPVIRTIQRWFERNGQIKPKSKLPEENKNWAKKVHEVWQIDAKEEIKLANGKKVCWLNIQDEHSSGVLAAPVFPLRQDLPSAGRTSPKGLD